MPVAYKKMLRKDPRDPQAAQKYYPRLITQGNSADLDDIAFLMKEVSSLSLGDIKSVLTNFSECMRTLLYTGQSVRIADFGTFSLGAQTTGEETEKACGVKNIRSVKINFRAATNVKPNLSSTRAGDRIKFYDVKTGVVEDTPAEGEDTPAKGEENNPGNPGDGGGGYIDPNT
jgi:predicted histone-like DNA-binding protein